MRTFIDETVLKVKVFTIGKCKEEWLNIALAEYEKRLEKRLSIEWLLAKDDRQLIEWTKGQPLIALDAGGVPLTSEEWSEKMTVSRLNFVIGGAEGVPSEILRNATFQWSLSPLIFTHQMVRLILVEQLYRGLEIQRGGPYHK